jgi:hypothetical protein
MLKYDLVTLERVNGESMLWGLVRNNRLIDNEAFARALAQACCSASNGLKIKTDKH